MKRRFPILILILFACGLTARAQQVPKASATPLPARPTPPAGPLLEPAPEFSSWEVRYIYPDDQAPGDKAAANKGGQDEAGRRLRQVTTTKTGKIVHEVSLYLSGKQTETWHDGKIQYEKAPGASFWSAKSGNILNGVYTDSGYVPFPASGFRDLNWISASTYLAAIPYGSRSCLVFVQTGADKINLNDPANLKKQLDEQDTVAYIDVESRLPVSLRTGKTVRAYHFTTPPTAMQTFPTDLAAEVKKGEDARTRVNTMAPRPY